LRGMPKSASSPACPDGVHSVYGGHPRRARATAVRTDHHRLPRRTGYHGFTVIAITLTYQVADGVHVPIIRATTRRITDALSEPPDLRRPASGGEALPATTERRHSSLPPASPSVTCASRGAVVVSSLVSSVYVRLRSLVFKSMQAMQVTDVNGIRRTIIPSPENRKVDGSTPSLATTSDQRRCLFLMLCR
jgi:hypothetical protein